MNPAVIIALVQAAATYGPPIVVGIKALTKDRSSLGDEEVLAELDKLILACEASDARIQAHVHKGDR